MNQINKKPLVDGTRRRELKNSFIRNQLNRRKCQVAVLCVHQEGEIGLLFGWRYRSSAVCYYFSTEGHGADR